MNLSAGIARNKLLARLISKRRPHPTLSDLVTCEVERILEDRTDSSCFGSQITARSLAGGNLEGAYAS